MAQNIATLRAVEGNQKEDVIPAFGPTISDQPRKPPKPSGTHRLRSRRRFLPRHP